MLSSREGPAVCALRIQDGELARMREEPRRLGRREEQAGNHRLDSGRAYGNCGKGCSFSGTPAFKEGSFGVWPGLSDLAPVAVWRYQGLGPFPFSHSWTAHSWGSLLMRHEDTKPREVCAASK